LPLARLPRLPSKVTARHASGMANNILHVTEICLAISFGIQNCNSLNVSTNCPKQAKKLRSILDIGTDIIFLSDIRLNNAANVRDIENVFMSAGQKQYKFIYNSSMMRRGVGMLISNHLNFDLLQDFHDVDENILGLHCNINGAEMLMICIYGPNTDNLDFFANLKDLILPLRHLPVIIGGDWNTTVSCISNSLNPDIFAMKGPPSVVRAQAL